jgi:carbonic anhydrase
MTKLLWAALTMCVLLNACNITTSGDTTQRVTTIDTTANDSLETPTTQQEIPTITSLKLHNIEVATGVSKYWQAPINLNTPGKAAEHKLSFNYVSEHEVIKNLGNIVKLNPEKGNSVVFDDKTYQLTQLRFYTPSKHRIDAEEYALETHLVHKAADSTFLVVSLVFEPKEENAFLNQLINNVPKNIADSTEKKPTLNLTKFFPSDQRFYTYTGSSTTPPYTSGVRWVIFKQPVRCSRAQLEIFRKTTDSTKRKLAPINQRKLEEF